MKACATLEEVENEDVDYDLPSPLVVSHNQAHAAFWKKQLVKHLFAVAFGRANAEGVTVSVGGSNGARTKLHPKLVHLHHEDAE